MKARIAPLIVAARWGCLVINTTADASTPGKNVWSIPSTQRVIALTIDDAWDGAKNEDYIRGRLTSGLRDSCVLLDEVHHVEHRQVHGDDDQADKSADKEHHDRLKNRRERLDRGVDFILVEIGDLVKHRV